MLESADYEGDTGPHRLFGLRQARARRQDSRAGPYRGGPRQRAPHPGLRRGHPRSSDRRPHRGHHPARHGRRRERGHGAPSRASGPDRGRQAPPEILYPLRGRPRPRRALAPHNGPYRRAGLPTDVLGTGFYDRDPREVAVDLLGCTLVHETPEGRASGVIVETEAYRPEDPACHAYSAPTMRNRNIFAGPGIAYVYVSYGIHHLLNVVCEEEGVGSAVLIRALRPVEGTGLMQSRRGRQKDLCSGPGRLTQALGVGIELDGVNLTDGPLGIQSGLEPEEEIGATTRIGISRGVDLPWRYLLLGERNVSVRPKAISARGLRRGRSPAEGPGGGDFWGRRSPPPGPHGG